MLYLTIGVKHSPRSQKELMSNRGCICNKEYSKDVLG